LRGRAAAAGAGIIGLIWIAGRAYCALSSYRDPETRGPEFVIGFVSATVLRLGALIGIVASLVRAGSAEGGGAVVIASRPHARAGDEQGAALTRLPPEGTLAAKLSGGRVPALWWC
jgi:hypothetical protein